MSVFTTIFYVLLGCLAVGVSVAFLIFLVRVLYELVKTIVQIIVEIPYTIYLGGYINAHDLPKDFRKRDNPNDSFKDALRFYNDILHFRKPTFD